MKDVVIVSPTPTWPLDFGNRKRIFQVANQLKAAGCRIHFILYALEQEWRTNSVFPEEEYRKLQEQWDFVHIVASTVGYHKSPDGDDHDLDEWWDPALEKFLWWYLHAQHIDAVIVNYIYLSRALTLAPPYTLKVLDTHDRFGGRRALLAKLGIQPEFFHLTIDDERRGLERADLVVAIKEEEEAYFQELSGRETLTAPFYEPIRPRSSSAASPPADGYLRVGLIGGRNSINRRSVERFLDRALPRIFATLAPIRVVLAGSMCADLEKYTSKYNVESMGVVSSVADFYDAVDVVVVPMEFSTGQKIKVGEALGYGVPVISHRHAFEGYSPQHHSHECASLQTIVEDCIDLAFDRSGLPALRNASQKAAEEQVKRGEAAAASLVSVISRLKPRAVFVVDPEQFARDAAYRALLISCGQFAAAVFNVLFFFTGDAETAQSVEDARSDLKQMGRWSRPVFAVGEVEAEFRLILTGSRVVSIWALGELDPAVIAASSAWRGVLVSQQSSQHAPGGSAPRGRAYRQGGGFAVACTLGALSLGGVPDGETRWFQVPTLPASTETATLLKYLRGAPTAFLAFDEHRDILHVANALRLCLRKTAIPRAVVLVPNAAAKHEILSEIEEDDAERVQFFDPAADAYQHRLGTPKLFVDFCESSGFAAYLRSAISDCDPAIIRREDAVCSEARLIHQGRSSYRILLDIIALEPSACELKRDKDGFAAIYNYVADATKLVL